MGENKVSLHSSCGLWPCCPPTSASRGWDHKCAPPCLQQSLPYSPCHSTDSQVWVVSWPNDHYGHYPSCPCSSMFSVSSRQHHGLLDTLTDPGRIWSTWCQVLCGFHIPASTAQNSLRETGREETGRQRPQECRRASWQAIASPIPALGSRKDYQATFWHLSTMLSTKFTFKNCVIKSRRKKNCQFTIVLGCMWTMGHMSCTALNVSHDNSSQCGGSLLPGFASLKGI